MVTNSGSLSPVVRAGAAVVFALVALVVAAAVWTVTYLSWWQAIGLESAALPATVVALVPLVGLGYVAVSTEGGPTLSTAAYVGCFAAASRDLREAAGVSSLSILPLEPVAADSDDPSLLERLRARLFRTHPPTERRLAALEELERERQ